MVEGLKDYIEWIVLSLLFTFIAVCIFMLGYNATRQYTYQVVCRNSAMLTFAGDFQEAYFEGEHIQTNRGAYFPGDFEQCEIVRRDGNGSR